MIRIADIKAGSIADDLGLPVGLSVVSTADQDTRVLALGRAIEAALT